MSPALAGPGRSAMPDGKAGESRWSRQSLWSRVEKKDVARTAFVVACALAVGLGVTWPTTRLPLVAVVGLVIGCWPVLKEAAHDLVHRRMSMELSMLIAIVAAAAIGEWVTSLVIAAFVLAAEILEDLSLDRGRDALTGLMTFLPQRAQVLDGDQVRDVPLNEVRPGQVLIIAPGGRIPVDGQVVAGHSSADTSRITGESLPVDLDVGASVYAGSVNLLGALQVRAEKVGADSSYGQIVETVRKAQAAPAPAQRLADKLAGYIVAFALVAAVVTWLLTRDLPATIAVVVVAGACGIAAGTPLAVLAAMARAARTGAFIKGGAHLEALSAIDTVVFDKTGTLTAGTPRVVALRPAEGISQDELLQAAASVETYSEHPLGQAIVAHAQERGLGIAAPRDFAYRPGLGVSGTVAGREVLAGTKDLVPGAGKVPDGGAATTVHVAIAGRYAGAVLLADQVRESAPGCVQDLKRMGISVAMLSGDRPEVARAIGDQLGIDSVFGGLLPADKSQIIEKLRGEGRTVAMVGDGVNDAPALAAAGAGIAMGSGTEIARESADIVLISTSLDDLTRTVAIARRARRIVLANLVGTIAVDLAGMALAASGLLAPVLAALVHVGSETAFILNSARLIPGPATGRSRGGGGSAAVAWGPQGRGGSLSKR